MTRQAVTRNSTNGSCATYTYCDHLSEGWYDEIKGFWKNQKIFVCVECCRIIKLDKNQRIEDVKH